MNKELQDVIAGVLTEHPRKPPRVVARLICEAIGDVRPRGKPTPVTACPRCAEWQAAVDDKSIRAQVIEVAAVKGRLKELAWWLFSQADRTGRRSG